MEAVNIVVKQNIANWVKEEPPALALLNGGEITSTIFIHTDETGLNPPTEEFPGDLGFEIKVSNGTKSKEAHVSIFQKLPGSQQVLDRNLSKNRKCYEKRKNSWKFVYI